MQHLSTLLILFSSIFRSLFHYKMIVKKLCEIYFEMDTTLTGYMFKVNIVWDSLLNGFDASEGTLIGFDVLASDNDNDIRTQLTWNAQTTMPWNDASLFGTLRLFAENSVAAVPDNENPSAPTNLLADESGSTITWDASTDNITVLTYIIYDGSTAVDTIYAKETGNTYTYTDTDVGTHVYGVMATDNSGNKSTKTTINVTIEESGLDKNFASFTKIYPNPSNGVFNVTTDVNSAINISVYDISGREIINDSFVENYIINLSASGVFYVHMNNGKQVETVKLIVR